MRRKAPAISNAPMSIASQSSAVNRTGSWRYEKPVFLERVAPCNGACPAGEDIDRVMLLNGQERFGDAYLKILEENPFPSVCGRVCPHPCEQACNRQFFDEAVSIRALERFAGDYAREQGISALPTARPQTGKRIAVVGSGPAGLSCAYFSASLGHDVTVFEAEQIPGGMLSHAIPAYRLPADVLCREIDRVLSTGITLRCAARIGSEISFDVLSEFDALFLSPGAPASEQVLTTQESLPHVVSALAFLRQVREGKASTLTGTVAIVGGGNTAIDAARVALRLGGRPHLLYRRSREEMPASEEEVGQAEAEGVALNFLTGVTAIVERHGAAALTCMRMELGERDPSGRRNVRARDNSAFELRADHVIVAAGQKADLTFLPPTIRTADGLIVVDNSLQTAQRNAFAGGDAIDAPRTVAHAVASGKKAAIAIDLLLSESALDALERVAVGGNGALSMAAYLQLREAPSGRLMKEVVPYEALNVDHFRRSPRKPPRALRPREAVKGFNEVEKGLSGTHARQAAQRCFNCGICSFCARCYEYCPDLAIRVNKKTMEREIDYEHCKGCGICIEECPRAAVAWEARATSAKSAESTKEKP